MWKHVPEPEKRAFCFWLFFYIKYFSLFSTSLSAGLLRQATYTTTRLGIYTVLFERMTKADGTPPNFLMKALIGMTAGATGAFVGTPAEVALIRMTADGR